jgi:hypothetical protein
MTGLSVREAQPPESSGAKIVTATGGKRKIDGARASA